MTERNLYICCFCMCVTDSVSECECLHFIRHQVLCVWVSVVVPFAGRMVVGLVYKVFIIICAHNLAEKGSQSVCVCSGVNEYVYIYSTWMCVTCCAFNFHKTAADAHPPDTTHSERLLRRKSKSTLAHKTIITKCAAQTNDDWNICKCLGDVSVSWLLIEDSGLVLLSETDFTKIDIFVLERSCRQSNSKPETALKFQ